MDRLLVAESSQLFLVANLLPPFNWKLSNDFGFDWRPIVTGGGNQGWVYESIIDLQGYQMKDMTAFFRRSFEQRGGIYSVGWSAASDDPLTSFDAGVFEIVLITTVPMSDDNLLASVIGVPGFINSRIPTIDQGNFNRDQIIHGRLYLHGIDSAFGADVFTDNGSAYTRIVQEYDFSSLEPTATDKLYLYRIIALSAAGNPEASGLTSVVIPPCRILLDTKFSEEEEIPYFMRLKRGYELANQV